MQFNEPFKALADYIRQAQPISGEQIERFRIHTIDPTTIRNAFKHLVNSWSAEYALRITPVVNDEQYLQSSLHWTFPQAYYSVLFSVRAMLTTMGINISNEDLIRKRVARLVVCGMYPPPLNTYVSGVDGKPMRRLIRESPENGAILLLPDTIYTEALQAKRKRSIKETFDRLQRNPKTALRSPQSGSTVIRMSKEQAREVSATLSPTTFFDFMSTLRISSTNRDLEKLQAGEINVLDFHKDLTDIVSYINTIHESIIVSSIGADLYRSLLSKEATYLRESFVYDRTINIINQL